MNPPQQFYALCLLVTFLTIWWIQLRLKVARMKKIKWLTCAAELNELMPDKSWSVFNARKDESETIPIVNSMLPLLRQNIGTYSIQKNSIKISKAIINVLNPGQVIADNSDSLSMFSFGNFSTCNQMSMTQENIYLCLMTCTCKNSSWIFIAY